MPGLDGLRALAVAVVIAYHLGLAWAPGGLLGVGVFFTLSGYLITDLLLSSWESVGHLELRTFWARRARRLLPALFVMLAVVSLWVAVADPQQLGALRGDVVAAMFYVSNWWLAFQHVSYFARFGPPSPLGHLWSLAVEEQFYLIWPWLLWLGLIWVTRRRYRQAQAVLYRPLADAAMEARPPEGGPVPPEGGTVPSGPGTASEARTRARAHHLWPLALVTVVLAAASAFEMAVLYHPSFDPSRIYDGTDTRAFALLLGAALAMVWPSKGLRSNVTIGARRLVEVMGVAGLVTIALLVFYTNQYSAFLYRGGMVILALATVLVVASASHPASRLGVALGCRPLRWAGVRSYAIYLWHYPVIVLTTPGDTALGTVSQGTDLPRLALQVGATLVLADLSWRFVETPVRNGALGRLWAQLRAWRASRAGLAGLLGQSPGRWVALSIVPVAVLLAALALAGLMPSAPAGTLAADNSNASNPFGTTAPPPPTGPPATRTTATRPPATTTSSTVTSSTTTSATSTPAATSVTTTAPTTAKTAASPSTAPTSAPTSLPVRTTVPVPPTPRLRTSCKQVVHIGDSTSESLVSADYLPDASQRLPAQYARVGVKRTILRIEGGTSVVETISPNEQNAYEMATALVHAGYQGCWVIALGTNDSADIYVGSSVGVAARIDKMMSLLGHDRVLWVNVKSLVSSGPYSEQNMLRWDKGLVAACPSYPTMRVFNWAAMAKSSWFTPDGIHYNSPGSAPRAAAIADALATAFPATTTARASSAKPKGTASSRCVINASPAWHLPAFHN
jgi:peptidoglycan/LPS O-acetylase OafA/YrhL